MNTTYITGPSTCSYSESNTEEPYTSTHVTVSSIELQEQSITTLEDEITSTPTRKCPIPLLDGFATFEVGLDAISTTDLFDTFTKTLCVRYDNVTLGFDFINCVQIMH